MIISPCRRSTDGTAMPEQWNTTVAIIVEMAFVRVFDEYLIRFCLGIVPPVIFDVLTQWGGFAILIENDKTTIMTRGKVYNLE